MSEEQLTLVLQHIHQLTQQNSPESAGAAWFELLTSAVTIARRDPRMFNVDIITAALKDNDLPVEELRQHMTWQAGDITWATGREPDAHDH